MERKSKTLLWLIGKSPPIFHSKGPHGIYKNYPVETRNCCLPYSSSGKTWRDGGAKLGSLSGTIRRCQSYHCATCLPPSWRSSTIVKRFITLLFSEGKINLLITRSELQKVVQSPGKYLCTMQKHSKGTGNDIIHGHPEKFQCFNHFVLKIVSISSNGKMRSLHCNINFNSNPD